MKNYFALIMALLFVSVNCHGASTERFVQIHEDSNHLYSIDQGSVTCVKHPKLKDVHIISAWVKKCPTVNYRTAVQINADFTQWHESIRRALQSDSYKRLTPSEHVRLVVELQQMLAQAVSKLCGSAVAFDSLEEGLNETEPSYKHTLVQYRFRHPSRTYSVDSKIYVSEAGQKPDSDIRYGGGGDTAILPESAVEKTYTAATEQAFKWSFSKWLGL